MVRPKTIEYLERALAMAQDDLARIKRQIERYIHVDVTSRSSIHDAQRMRESGFNINDATDAEVEATFVVEELSNILYRKRRENERSEPKTAYIPNQW